jgi:cytochrome b subunit of formate dehydrogenase
MKKKIYHQRFDLIFIIQHIILLSSVLLLIVSGVPLKFPESQFAVFVINLQGGMKMRSLIHHSAGLTLIFLGAFHFVYYVFLDRKVPFYKRAIIPKLQDLRDLYHHFKYVVGLADHLPPMGRYTWYEKFDYIGLFWGIAVMGISGMSMLYMDVVLTFIPLALLQVLWAMHSEEAMLATLFLLIIHMYHVHFNPERYPMSLTWLNGKISKHEMEKYHPLELEQLEESPQPDPERDHAGQIPGPVGQNQ